MDGVELELFKNQLGSVVEEMSLTVIRTAASQIVRDVMDFSTAMCDSKGQLVAQGLGLALHLGAVPPAMQTIMKTFGPSLQPGDIYVLNDPYSGGMHLPDIFMFKPAFATNGTLLGFSVVIAHQADIGGRVPGGNAADSTEIFQEGLRIPPLRLWTAGQENTTLMNIIRDNVRVPDKVLGDVRAQVAACHMGEVGLQRLYQRYGDELAARLDELLDYTERLARHEMALLPKGRWQAEDWLDDNGIAPIPTKIVAAVEITDDKIIVDFTGSSPQVAGAINCTHSYACSAAYCVIRMMMKNDVPSNEGFFRPIEVITELGSVLNPRFPAAVAARGVTGYRAGDAIMAALAKAVPDRVIAGNWGGGTVLAVGGKRLDGSRFILTESIHGNWGGRPTKDGLEGLAHHMANLANDPVEHIEAEYPLQILHYEFVQDSGGPGKYRGGLATRRRYHFLGESATLQLRSDRLRFPPQGVDGGLPGPLAQNILIRNGEVRQLPSKFTIPIEYDDIFEHLQAGAAGHGRPELRDPQAVLADVLDEKVSPQHAASAYNVQVGSAGKEA